VFRFSNNPAAIGVFDGIQDALTYLQTSWRKWLPVVGVIAAFSFVAYVLTGPLDPGVLYHTDVDTGRVVLNSDALSKLYGSIASGLSYLLLAAIGGWFFSATAIGGLRNRPLTFSRVIARGLVTVLSGIIVAAAAAILVTGLILVAVVAPPLRLTTIMLALGTTPVAIYLLVRLVFTGLAIFDGFGPIGGIQESWRLSQGSVSRIFGWGMLALLMNIAIGAIASIIVSPFSMTGIAPLAQAASAAIATTGSCLVVFMMAVLYESERACKDPTLYPYPAWLGYGSQPAGPYAPGPALAYPARPYAPGPYTAGPYAGGPDPASPASPAALDPAAGPDPAPLGNSAETDPTQQPPNAL
jgi:hypothetical protein